MNLKELRRFLKEKINMIVVDTAHGHTKKVSEVIKFIKKIKTKKPYYVLEILQHLKLLNFYLNWEWILSKLELDLVQFALLDW